MATKRKKPKNYPLGNTTLVKGAYGGPTPKITKVICDLLRMGAYLETAAVSAGVTPRTLRNWLSRAGKAADPPSAADAPFVVFMRELQQAHAQAEHQIIAGIAQAAVGTPSLPMLDEDGVPILDGKGNVLMTAGVNPDWRAGAWLAERKHQDRWAQTRKIDVRVQQGVEQLLDAVRGRMPSRSYRDLIHALDEVRQAELRGDTEVS